MNRSRYLWWAFAMGGLVALPLVMAVYLGGFPVNRLYGKLAKPLVRLSLAIGVGLLIGIFIENANLTARLGRGFAPLLRFAHLKELSASAFTTPFFSAIAASTMLMNAHQDGAISRRELVVAALIELSRAGFPHRASDPFRRHPRG